MCLVHIPIYLKHHLEHTKHSRAYWIRESIQKLSEWSWIKLIYIYMCPANYTWKFPFYTQQSNQQNIAKPLNAIKYQKLQLRTMQILKLLRTKNSKVAPDYNPHTHNNQSRTLVLVLPLKHYPDSAPFNVTIISCRDYCPSPFNVFSPLLS